VIHGLWAGDGNTRIFFWGIGKQMRGSCLSVKVIFLALGIGLASVLTGLGEENSSGRLENAQQGVAEGSWPKKPDNRLSPLSGKMKNTPEISPRFYGSEREIAKSQTSFLEKESTVAQKPFWSSPESQSQTQKLWAKPGESRESSSRNEAFSPRADLISPSVQTHQEIARKSSPGWISRPARKVQRVDGSLQLYEGRLTRVRETVLDDQASPRDLGPGRQEKFSPQEVEQILSRPVNEIQRPLREQPRGASPLAVADN